MSPRFAFGCEVRCFSAIGLAIGLMAYRDVAVGDLHE